MGLTKLAHQLNRSFDDAKKFLEKYTQKLPFIKYTLTKASNMASDRGYVKTILNRRRRFTLWEPFDWRLSKQVPAVRNKKLMQQIVEDEIKRAIDDRREPPRPGVRIAKTHAALNAIVQGSAADLIKKAMVDCYEAGLFKVLIPHLTVHDELDDSVPKTQEGEEAFKEQTHTMETAIPFKVPIRVDAKLQKNWGEEK
jgi:DNA polymerase-1